MMRLAAIGLIGFALLVTARAFAGVIDVPTLGGVVNVEVVSIKEARFKTVVPQRYDFSCGSAALATLLTYHYGAEVTEAQTFESMYKVGDKEKIHKEGFSLLDMKVFLASIGIKADGFEMNLDQLSNLGIPAITLIDIGGYKHFVVVKGFRDDEVLVVDPAQGIVVMPRRDFQAMWNGIAFMVRQDVEVARSHFNDEHEWEVRTKAPFGTALSRHGLASFTMGLPGVNEF
jgi:predicted double-glycine peptidase